MIFNKIPLEGAMIIEMEKIEDNRGYFARCYCNKEFSKMGLESSIKQCNLSENYKKGTIRGMHYQSQSFAEDKIVRCCRGAVYDVIVDLRKSSSTYLNWYGVELSEENQKMMYAPKGVAHGFQVLEDNSTLFYMITEYYNPKAGRGVRWNDPAFNIKWPLEVTEISDKDKSYPDYR